MANNGLTDADYDNKLREMGNYLWDLEQQADLASAEGKPAVVDQSNQRSCVRRNERAPFSRSVEAIEFWQPLSPASDIAWSDAGPTPPIIS